MAEFAQDMRFKVDLDSGLVPQSMRTILVQGDAYANRIVTELTRDGKPFEAEGMTVVGAFMRPGDEARIDLEGAMENGEASVTLTDTCYEVSGQYTLDIILVQGEKRRTVLRIVGAVERRGNGQIVISGTLTNIDATLEEIRAAVENAETVKNELQTFSDTHIAEIEQKGQQTMTAIEQKAAQTLETIPEEYTVLDADVKSLKDHTADIVEAMPLEARTQRREYAVEWEQGALSNVDGSESSNTRRIRSDYIPVGMGIEGSRIDESSDVMYWVRVYDAGKNFIGNAMPNASGDLVANTDARANPVIVDTVTDVFPAAGYIRIVGKVGTAGSANIAPSESNMSFTAMYYDKLNGLNLDEVYQKRRKAEYSNQDIELWYDVSEGVRNKGFLKLPPNYSQSGKPSPLIVFVHGSSDFGSINVTSMTTSYNDYYNFLRDSGYAVFDCYGYGTKYTGSPGGYSNTWGIPINRQCYSAGIKHVCKTYNIDAESVFVACKSLGGLQALSMFYDECLPIKAVGMLAPEINIFNVNMGYTEANRRTIAAELEFSEDVNNVLAFAQGENPPDGFWEYVDANTQKWSGHFAIFNGLPIKSSEKKQYYRNMSNTRTMCRASLNRPVKIWVAEDDDAISYAQCSAFIASLNNGGYKGEIRTMPSGTGKHNAVDSAANALQTTEVTTNCGVYYATIPTAYYELAQFFDKNR